MAVDSVSIGNMAAYQSQPLNAVVSPNKTAIGNSPSKDQPSKKAVQTSLPNANVDSNKIFPLEKKLPKQSPVASNADISSQPSGAVGDVIVTYNPQGKMRTKFLDSRNNVVYQVPPEMLAKMQDLMMDPETSTNIKG